MVSKLSWFEDDIVAELPASDKAKDCFRPPFLKLDVHPTKEIMEITI